MDFYRVDSPGQLAKISPLVLRKDQDVETPAVLISGHWGPNQWASSISKVDLQSAALCLVSEPDLDLVFIGIGRTLRAYDALTGTPTIAVDTEYPIQSVTPLGPTLAGAFLVVTEISVAKYSSQGQIMWEYWHYEPIDSSWIDQQRLELIDFEKRHISISLETGRTE